LIYDKCTRDENIQNPVINNPHDSIVQPEIIFLRDTADVIYKIKYVTKTKTEYVQILDTFLVRELDKYKSEYLKLLDSLNVKVTSNYDTTFEVPVYMKKLGIESECLTGIFALDILKAQENWVINNPTQIYCPPRSFYESPYFTGGSGIALGVLIGLALGGK